jgi:hypothetical protein
MIVEIFQILERAQVRYALIGGLAVTLHGHVRSTMDVDIVLAMDDDNLRAFVSAFEAEQWEPNLPLPFRALLNEASRREWAEKRNLKAFAIHHKSKPYLSLDVLLESSVPLAQIVAAAELKKIGDTTVKVASVDHLIAMKRVVGRAVDLSDVAALEQLHKK